MAEVAESEADALDSLDEVVDCLGRSVGDPSGVPGNDVVAPTPQCPCEGADLGRHRLVGHVLDELVDVGAGEFRIVDVVQVPDGLLSVNRPSTAGGGRVHHLSGRWADTRL